DVAARPDVALLHERATLALGAPAVILELEEHLARETVVELRHIDVVQRDASLAEGLLLRRLYGHVGVVLLLPPQLVADLAGAEAQDVDRRPGRVLGPLGRRQDDRDSAVGDQAD